jgi:hypothetical protein
MYYMSPEGLTATYISTGCSALMAVDCATYPRRCEPLHMIAFHPTCQAYPWNMGGSRCSTLFRGYGQRISSFQPWDEALNPRLDFIRH